MTKLQVRNRLSIAYSYWHRGFPGGAGGKEFPGQGRETQKTRVSSLGQEDPLEKEMAAPSSILAWRIPWTEEPGGLQFITLQRVNTTEAT